MNFMNIRGFSFLILIISVIGIFNVSVISAEISGQIKILPKPILFFSEEKLCDNLLEYIDLNKKQDELEAKEIFPQDSSELDKKEDELDEKINNKLADLAKRLDVCAILATDFMTGYVDDSYDITQELIDELNKEYLAMK